MNSLVQTLRPLRPLRRAGGCGAVFALGVLLFAGCASRPRVSVDWRGGPYFQPTNFTGPAEMPMDVRRVAVLPPAGRDGFPAESTEGIVAALQAAVGQAARFEPIVIPAERWTAITGRASVASSDALAPEWFEALAREYGADAVLFTDLTEFRAYAPLALGVRCKLARVADDRAVIWAFDTVFDVRNPAVANSAQRHAAKAGVGAPADASPLGLQSPRRFAAYVFETVFTTLPARKTTLKSP